MSKSHESIVDMATSAWPLFRGWTAYTLSHWLHGLFRTALAELHGPVKYKRAEADMIDEAGSRNSQNGPSRSIIFDAVARSRVQRPGEVMKCRRRAGNGEAAVVQVREHAVVGTAGCNDACSCTRQSWARHHRHGR